MTTVTLRGPDGRTCTVEVEEGTSVMEAALREGVAGIVADCGGQCQCATCHVYVPAEHADRLPPMGEDEDDMLEVTASPRTRLSRLSCQLLVRPGTGELVLDLPARQR